MSFMLYDPVNRNPNTYEHLYLGKQDKVTSKSRDALLFMTVQEAIEKRDKTASAAGMVPIPAFDMTMHSAFVAAIRRTFDVICIRAFDQFGKNTLTPEEVRSYVMDYIENQSPGSHTRKYFWMPLEENEKEDYLHEAFNQQQYKRPAADE